MRRLVVISGKSKLIATFAAIAFSLTSLHLAAKAHIASLQREQQQLERSAMQQPSVVSQETQVAASKPTVQIPANVADADQKVTAPKTQPKETMPHQQPPRAPSQHLNARSSSALRPVNWRSSITARS